MGPDCVGTRFGRWLNNDPLVLFPIPLKRYLPKNSGCGFAKHPDCGLANSLDRYMSNMIKSKTIKHFQKDLICVSYIVLVSENTPRIKQKHGLVEELI